MLVLHSLRKASNVAKKSTAKKKYSEIVIKGIANPPSGLPANVRAMMPQMTNGVLCFANGTAIAAELDSKSSGHCDCHRSILRLACEAPCWGPATRRRRPATKRKFGESARERRRAPQAAGTAADRTPRSGCRDRCADRRRFHRPTPDCPPEKAQTEAARPDRDGRRLSDPRYYCVIGSVRRSPP